MPTHYALECEMTVEYLAISCHDNVAMAQTGFGYGTAVSGRVDEYARFVRNGA